MNEKRVCHSSVVPTSLTCHCFDASKFSSHVMCSHRDYLDAMSHIIIESNGTVDKYVFEGIVVFWNAPYSIKEHSAVGCDVALKCQRRLMDLQGGKRS